MKVQWLPGRRGLGLGEIYALIGVVAIAAARFFPFERFGGLLACPLRRATGVPCFSCGFTRAFVRTAHLDLAGAWHASPLGTGLFLSIVLFVVLAGLRFAFRWPWPKPLLTRGEAWAVRILVAVILLGNWGWLLFHRFVVGDWS